MVKAREEPPLKAKVTVPHKQGHRGPYFEAKCKIGVVTVSLSKDVWQENTWPEGGNYVLLWDIREKQGWRAYKARFFRPGDEELFGKKG